MTKPHKNEFINPKLVKDKNANSQINNINQILISNKSQIHIFGEIESTWVKYIKQTNHRNEIPNAFDSFLNQSIIFCYFFFFRKSQFNSSAV